MRFYLGEIYEGIFANGPRQALVVEITANGLSGKLRFFDSPEECTIEWADLNESRKWQRIESP